MKKLEEKVEQILSEGSFFLKPSGSMFKDADKIYFSMEKDLEPLLKELSFKLKTKYNFTIRELQKEYGPKFLNELKNLMKDHDILRYVLNFLK